MHSIEVPGGHLREAREFFDAFVESTPAKRFVLGRGEYAEAVADFVPIAGFVDDFSEVAMWRDLPVLQARELPQDALVISASMLRPISAIRQLENFQLSAMDYFGVAEASKGRLPLVRGWHSFREDYLANQDRYLGVRSRMIDDKSIETFDRIVSFRLTGDLSYMHGFHYDPTNQYFEDFLDLQEAGESFLDIGAYEGETSLEFMHRCPEFAHVYAIEASPSSFETLTRNLGHLPSDQVTLINAAAGSELAYSKFRDDRGTASAFDPSGSTTVRIEKVDALGINGVTFIKMDIEGAEEAALRGSEATIRQCQPRIALAAYHKPDDFWRLPDQIERMDVDFELAMRHYTEGIDETVLFFLPASS